MNYVIGEEFRYLTPWIKELSTRFDSEGEVLWNGRNVVKRYVIDGKAFVVKRYKHPNIFQRITYTFFGRSKARRAYEFAAEFRKRGIDTPKEVAYMEGHRHALFTTGYFISENCVDPEVISVLPREGAFDKDVAVALAEYVAKMHINEVCHGDLNLTNFLFHINAAGTVCFSLIDINRSHFGAMNKMACAKNLARLTYRRDLLEFLVCAYANFRSWNSKELINMVNHYLNKLEKKNAFKHKLKALLKKPS